MTAYVYFVCMHMITYVSIIYILFMPPNTSNKACYFDLDGILKVLFRLPWALDPYVTSQITVDWSHKDWKNPNLGVVHYYCWLNGWWNVVQYYSWLLTHPLLCEYYIGWLNGWNTALKHTRWKRLFFQQCKPTSLETDGEHGVTFNYRFWMGVVIIQLWVCLKMGNTTNLLSF